MKWRILHRTTYQYGAPAHDSLNDVRLEPAANESQTVESFVLTTTPAAQLRRYADFYGNAVHHFEIAGPHSTLVIESRSVVATHPPGPLFEEEALGRLGALPDGVKMNTCFDYLGASRFVDIEPPTWRLAVDATEGMADTWQAARAIMRCAHGYLTYTPDATHVHTHARQVLADRRGVCQDFAHLMLGMCRTLRIPARYVSGYLAAERASATHAWVEVLLSKVGWLALDPTHNRQADASYIKLGVGRDYADVPPVSGYYKGSLERKMDVEVKIQAV